MSARLLTSANDRARACAQALASLCLLQSSVKYHVDVAGKMGENPSLGLLVQMRNREREAGREGKAGVSVAFAAPALSNAHQLQSR